MVAFFLSVLSSLLRTPSAALAASEHARLRVAAKINACPPSSIESTAISIAALE